MEVKGLHLLKEHRREDGVGEGGGAGVADGRVIVVAECRHRVAKEQAAPHRHERRALLLR